MDARHPTTGIVIEGEHLARERLNASRPFPFTPGESFWIVAAVLVAIGFVLWRI